MHFGNLSKLRQTFAQFSSIKIADTDMHFDYRLDTIKNVIVVIKAHGRCFVMSFQERKKHYPLQKSRLMLPHFTWKDYFLAVAVIATVY